MATQLSYKIDVFEGPMDLLLNLISKNKLDIYDVPISLLLEQYLEHIRLMENENLDIASEFLEMASRLVYLKTLSLLPKHEEEEQLKKELTGQLLEYRLCKIIASRLAKQANMDRLIKVQENIPIDLRYKRKHNPNELIVSYLSAVGRGKRFLPPPEEKFSGIVSRKIVSVTSQVIFVLRKLWKIGESSYKDLFKNKKDSSERVAAFLALLELVKAKRIKVVGDVDEEKVILLNRRDSVDE